MGYEINFNRYFYRYTPPRPVEEIEADIRVFETDILRMLVEVTGSSEIGHELSAQYRNVPAFRVEIPQIEYPTILLPLQLC